MTADPTSQAARPLKWRKPTEFDRDTFGHEGAEWLAEGIGGHYAIQADLARFILWRIEDPFAFDHYDTAEAAKAAAEAHWQASIRRVLTTEQPR